LAPLTVGIEAQGLGVREIGEIAAAADQAGLACAWAPELYDRSATIAAAEMINRTSRITVGTGIAYGVGRSPLTLAAEARDLDELSGGRFVLGLGNGTRRMIADWHGADGAAPAVRMEELVPLVRRLWQMHEGAIEHRGRFYRVSFRATGEVVPPSRRIPIWTAGVNPRMIETAGRVADGLLGHVLFTTGYIEDVVLPAVDRGARRTERSPSEVQVASLILAAVDDDAERARREVAGQLAFYGSVKSYAPLLERIGFAAEGEAIRAAFGRRDYDAMVAAVPDAMIDRLALAGTPEDVRAGLRRYEGLLDHAILYAAGFQLTPQRVRESALSLIRACASTPGAATASCTG
jgi:probable F420-dependent oxidoreductase